MQNNIEYHKNELWDATPCPLVSVVICVFNRRDTILRAMQSVDRQTFRDIELIVVDNGSTTKVDDVILDFLNQATVPVLFIKRSYGKGPMTGRNSGLKSARGQFVALLDDDDEYLPHAMQAFVAEWNNIPPETRHQYREVVARCQDQNGNLIGVDFPEDINTLPWKEALKTCHDTGSAHMALNRTEILQDNLFPEPEGVTMVNEGLIWEKLSKVYKSWYFNDIVYTYYLDSSDSYCHTFKKRNPQQVVINGLFNSLYALNHWDDYEWKGTERIKTIIKYNVYRFTLINKYGGLPQHEWVQNVPKGLLNTFLRKLLYIPSFLAYLYYSISLE